MTMVCCIHAHPFQHLRAFGMVRQCPFVSGTAKFEEDLGVMTGLDDCMQPESKPACNSMQTCVPCTGVSRGTHSSSEELVQYDTGSSKTGMAFKPLCSTQAVVHRLTMTRKAAICCTTSCHLEQIRPHATPHTLHTSSCFEVIQS